jgi:hypothetical protein
VSAAPVDLRCASAVIDLFDRAADTLRASPLRHGCAVTLPARGRLIATGDLHDNPMHLRKIMTIARLHESPDTHVVLHEMIHGERLVNGLDFSYRVLARAAELVIEHAPQVHPLLANHELAQMAGKSISKGAGDSVKMFNDAIEYVFSDDAIGVGEAIGRYIAAFPLALRSEAVSDDADSGCVFVSHSLPSPAVMDSFELGILDRELNEDDYTPRVGSAWKMVWGRGHTREQTEILAANWNVKLFIIGHEKAETGVEIRGPKLLVLNTDHERGSVLPVELTDVPDAYLAALSAVPLAAVADVAE